MSPLSKPSQKRKSVTKSSQIVSSSGGGPPSGGPPSGGPPSGGPPSGAPPTHPTSCMHIPSAGHSESSGDEKHVPSRQLARAHADRGMQSPSSVHSGVP